MCGSAVVGFGDVLQQMPLNTVWAFPSDVTVPATFAEFGVRLKTESVVIVGNLIVGVNVELQCGILLESIVNTSPIFPIGNMCHE